MLTIVKIGTTFPDILERYGDFDAWISDGLGSGRHGIRVVDAEHGEPLPPARTCSGVVVTGSHAMITDNPPWTSETAEWIPLLLEKEIPFLGICYGHQLLAQAMGGEAGFHPGGKEIGTVEIELLPESAADPLFSSLPSPLAVQAAHAQTVLALPPGAVRLAGNGFEPHHAFRLGPCAWGLQFHPEFNRSIVRSYVLNQAKELEAAGRDLSAILGALKETPFAALILRRFAALARARRSV